LADLVIRSDLGGIARITLGASAASKGFSSEGVAAIAEVINCALDDEEIRAIVITGSGRWFCAGADVAAFSKAIEDDSIVALVENLTDTLHPLLVKMRQSSTICVAALNGAAAGGGLGLALACDYRVCGESALLVAGFASLGLSPDGGTTWLLPRLVGDQTARRFILENSRWKAAEALAEGAVDEVVANEELLDRAHAVAAEWSKWSHHTREATKHLIEVQSTQDFATHLRHEQVLIMAASASEGFREGVNSFLEKRQPDFK